MPILSLQDAKDHIQPGSQDADGDLLLKLEAAEAIVFDYINTTDARRLETALWVDSGTLPPLVRAAILLQLGELYRFRGDDTDGPIQTAGDLSPTITNILRRYRDPVVA